MDKGWGWLQNSKKWHYFIGGRSICGKWLGLGLKDLEDANDESPDNCAKCRTEVKKIRVPRGAKSNE